MISMSLQQVIDLNNTAVHRMKTSHPQDAVEMFTQAIQCYKSIHQELHYVHTFKPISNQEALINACFIQEQRCRQSSIEIESSSNNFVYSNACLIPNELVDSSLIAPIIIFNLALARHYEGARIQNDEHHRRHILSTATRLYEIAFHTYIASGGSRCGLMAIAITNNAGLIYQEFGQSELSQKCFQRLHAVLAHLLSHGDTSIMAYAYDFLRNLVPIQGPEVYAAGAA